ncbi:hypothetical protein Btru_005281 [Bulinus truncatus]|nr:hypothetical protein Btru_005281 [Bulinus truncatus]
MSLCLLFKSFFFSCRPKSDQRPAPFADFCFSELIGLGPNVSFINPPHTLASFNPHSLLPSSNQISTPATNVTCSAFVTIPPLKFDGNVRKAPQKCSSMFSSLDSTEREYNEESRQISLTPNGPRGVYFAIQDEGGCVTLVRVKVYYLSLSKRYPELCVLPGDTHRGGETFQWCHRREPVLTTPLRRQTCLTYVEMMECGMMSPRESACVTRDTKAIKRAHSVLPPHRHDGSIATLIQHLCGQHWTVGHRGLRLFTILKLNQLDLTLSISSSGLHNLTVSCPAGTYKWSEGSGPCEDCPAYSYSTGGSAECTCQLKYYRSPRDPKSKPCTQPPSAPRNPIIESQSSTSVTLSWDPPLLTWGQDKIYFTA